MPEQTEVEQFIPNFAGKLGDFRAERDLELAIRRLYEYIDRENFKLKDIVAKPQEQMQLPFEILSSDDGLSKTLGAPVADGFITVRDNAGHIIRLISTA